MSDSTLAACLEFIKEIDALKGVQRRSRIMDDSRRENSAEHSWHVAVAALVLASYANETIDVGRVVAMLLLHDVVEIDAGDTFAYDEAGKQTQAAREALAAERLFGLLPTMQQQDIMSLWDEFDEQTTAESRFALALDRMLPLLHNYVAGGGTWLTYGVTRADVDKRMAPIRIGSEVLGREVDRLLDDAVAQGFLKP